MAAKIGGTAIIYWEDPNANKRVVLKTINTRMMVKTYTQDQLPILEFFPKKRVFRYGDKLCIDFISAITTAEIAPEKGAVTMPITVKNLRANVREEAEIDIVGKYSFTEDVVTGTQSKAERILYFACPKGIEFVLGKKKAFNSRLMISIWSNA